MKLMQEVTTKYEKDISFERFCYLIRDTVGVTAKAWSSGTKECPVSLSNLYTMPAGHQCIVTAMQKERMMAMDLLVHAVQKYSCDIFGRNRFTPYRFIINGYHQFRGIEATKEVLKRTADEVLYVLEYQPEFYT